MDWLEIRVRIRVGENGEGSRLVATIGDAIADHALLTEQPWYMTSEFCDDQAEQPLVELLDTMNRSQRVGAVVR